VPPLGHELLCATDMRKRDDATAERVLRRSRIEAGWHPGIELAVMSVRPDLPDAIKTVILKVLLENTVVSATDKARLEAGESAPTAIKITIASWAASHGGPKAVETKPAIKPAVAIDHVATDSDVHAHRGTPPQPYPTEPKYQEYDLFRDGGGVERPVPIEPVKTERWKPRRYVFNPATAFYDVEED